MNTVLEQFTKGTVFFIQRIDSIKFGLCKWNCIGTGFHIRQFFPRCRQSTIPAINDGNEILSRFYLFTVDVSSFVMDFKYVLGTSPDPRVLPALSLGFYPSYMYIGSLTCKSVPIRPYLLQPWLLVQSLPISESWMVEDLRLDSRLYLSTRPEMAMSLLQKALEFACLFWILYWQTRAIL